jgi:hypothetical protein
MLSSIAAKGLQVPFFVEVRADDQDRLDTIDGEWLETW